ncbi:hypothetical protein [Mycolicibacterium vinylchloridicum]|uniref:hypothetical protein n=1 Tax=Mycolicibacterium vinylchloridicum TaxID=2736928 RepID=UPI0015C6CB43|nr:hypothetical protein [Mycolicibacterium vinylchloridicum]
MVSPFSRVVLVMLTVPAVLAAAGCHSTPNNTSAGSTATPGVKPSGGASAPDPTAAASDGGSLVGTWESSDNTGTKSFSSDGRCDGFFYNSGKPLDIGGPMECALASKPDSAGRYKLVVTQGPNKATYSVQFSGDDAATVYAKDGTRLYDLTRF